MIARPAQPSRDRGSISVELTVLLPAFIALIALAIIIGRQTIAQGAVDIAAHDAAHDAARAASLARIEPLARTRGQAAASQALAQQGLFCVGGPTATVNASQMRRPVGQPALVFVTVRCNVSFADIAMVPGVPGTRTITSTFVGPVDQYRGRG